MLNEKKRDSRDRRIENLQKRIEKITDDYKELEIEKRALENELEVCHAKIACVEKAEEEFMSAIAQTKQIRERYERAYDELKTITARYSAEVSRLIKQMRH